MIEAESATSSSLVVNTRCLVLEALASPSSLPASSKPKKSTSSRPYPPEQDPQVLSVLLKAISRQSPLQPVTSGDGLLRLHLNILRRIMSTEWDDVKWRYRGVTCGWLCVKVLEGMAAVLNGKETLSELVNYCRDGGCHILTFLYQNDTSRSSTSNLHSFRRRSGQGSSRVW